MHTHHVMLAAFSENICDTEFTPFTMWLLRSKSYYQLKQKVMSLIEPPQRDS